MKRLVVALSVAALIGAAVAWSDPRPSRPDFDFLKEERNPVTHFNLNNNPADFQFAIVSDRTGGHRARIFSRAVQQLNLVQPEFVVSVGDLIEGYTEDKDQLAREWKEFQGYVSQLTMPFFYVPGNHDITNAVMDDLWKEKFGRRYYDFVYRDVLFLMLNSEDPPTREGSISEEQRAFVQKALEANKNVRWTLVFLHKPLWTYSDPQKNGWEGVEKLLAGRNYSVFAGHVHRYQRFIRNGQRYYMLATTGGISKLRGPEYGEFDHIVWVTMKKDGPVLANLLMDGILRENLQPIETPEEGAPALYRKLTQAVKMKLLYQGQPLPGAYVVLERQVPGEPWSTRADGFSQENGAVTLSSYQPGDGVPEGEYTVSVVCRKPMFDDKGNPGPNLLPEKYGKAGTSELKVTIQRGNNDITLELK